MAKDFTHDGDKTSADPADQVCTPEDDRNPDVDAQLQGAGTQQVSTPAPAVAAPRPAPSLERGLHEARTATQLAELLRAALVPAFRRAVDAIDPLAATELATHVYSAYATIESAREDVVGLFPADDPARWMVSTPDSPIDDTAEATTQRWTELQLYRSQLIADEGMLTQELMIQLSPQTFRGEQVMAGAVAPLPKKHGAARLAVEAGATVELLAVVHQIRALSGGGEACVDLDEAQRTAIAALVEPFKARPIDLAFLVRVLEHECIWELVQGVAGPSGRPLAQTVEKSAAQAKETGAFQDLGDFDADQVEAWLSTGDDVDANLVFLELKYMPASARGPVIQQIDRMGRLDDFCDHMPWQYVKALHDILVTEDPAAAGLLFPYFDGKGGGKSLHKVYEEQIMDNLEEGGFVNNAQAFGWTFLDTAHNAFTGGFLHEYSDAYDAHEQGWTTDDEFTSSSAKALGKAAVITLAGAAIGGGAGTFAEGVATGLGAGRSAATLIGGGVGGFAGGVGSHFAGDVYDQLLNGKEGFDDASAYMKSGAIGGAMGVTLAGVSLAGGKYLPASQQRMVDIYAQRYPRMTRVLEELHGAGAGTGVQIRVKVSELIDMIDSGMAGPGGPGAYALAGGGDWRMLPGDAEISVRLRPPEDFNRPMMMSGGDKDGPGGTLPKDDGVGGTPKVDAAASGEHVKIEGVEASPDVLAGIANRPKLPQGFDGEVVTDQAAVVEHATTPGSPKTEFTKVTFKLGREQQVEFLAENIQGLTQEQAQFLIDYVQKRDATIVFGGSRQKGTAGPASDFDIGSDGLTSGQRNGMMNDFNKKFGGSSKNKLVEHNWIHPGGKPQGIPEIVSPEEFFMRSGVRIDRDPLKNGQPFFPSGYTKITPDGTVEVGIPQ